jgi:hypothetical protein
MYYPLVFLIHICIDCFTCQIIITRQVTHNLKDVDELNELENGPNKRFIVIMTF